MKNELQDNPVHPRTMDHYVRGYGGNDMNPPSLLTMRNMVGILILTLF